jgi:hypothetical protein
MPYKKLQYPNYIKEIDPNAHIRLFKKAIKANGEIVEVDIINMFGFILRDNIYEWDENYVQDHPNYTFEELEQTFCKLFIIVKNNEEVYIQLHNIKQQTTKCVEVYYEHLLKLVNCLHVRAIYVFLTTIFRASLLPYLKLAIAGMKINTLIKHKEVTILCEESGLVSLSYNVLLTTRVVNVVVKSIVLIIIVKSTLTYTNCGKMDHLVETCHNKKRELPVVPTATIKSTKPIAGTKK